MVLGFYSLKIVADKIMSICNIFDGSFVADIKNLLQSDIKKNDPDLIFPVINDNNWRPRLIRQNKRITNVFKQVLTRAQITSKELPYSCIPYVKKYEDPEIELNIKNWSFPNVEQDKQQWQLETTDNEVLRTYFVGSGDPYGGKEIFANYADILPKIPVNNNTYLKELYDSYPQSNTFPANKLHDGIGINNFFKHKQPTKNLQSYGEIIIDWNISEKIGEIPFDGIESHHEDISVHKKSYERFLQTGKTCGNFIYFPPDLNSRSFISIVKEFLPSEEEFTIPYGFKAPYINNVFYGKEKKASYWNWDYISAVLCWYKYDPSLVVQKLQNNDLVSKDHIIYISEGDVFEAKNLHPINILSNDNVVTEIIPAGSPFLYISKNIYGKFLKILERLESSNNEFKLLNNRIKIETAAIYAAGPSYDEVTLDAISSNSLFVGSVEDIYSLNQKGFTEIVPSAIQKIVDSTKLNNSFVEYYENISSVFMNSINNFFIEQILKVPFKHNYDNSNLNYAHDVKSLIQILDNKYGSYISIDSNKDVRFVNESKYLNKNISFETDIEILPKIKTSMGVTNTKIDCSLPKKMGYHQEIKIAGKTIKTISASPKSKNACSSKGNIHLVDVAHTTNLILDNNIVDTHISVTGTKYTKYTDTYYRGSYDLALIIDGEKICSEDRICDKKLKDKYHPTYTTDNGQVINEDVIPREFINKDIKRIRQYDGVFLNPNLHTVGVQNDTTYIESNSFDHQSYSKINFSSTEVNFPYVMFTVFDTKIKIHNIKIKNLRSTNHKCCESIPVVDKCKCYPIVKHYEFLSNCDGSLVFKSPEIWTPNVKTMNIPIRGGRKTINTNPNIGLSYHDYARLNVPLVTENAKTCLLGMDRYMDPVIPYECTKTFDIVLPVHTTTKWQFDLTNFKYDKTKGYLWATVSENHHRPFIDRNQIGARFADGTTVYPNQWKIIQNPNSVTLFDSFNVATLAEENILYQPLPCSYEKNTEASNIINTATISFKYIPHQYRLSFLHNKANPLGTLSHCIYNTGVGILQLSKKISDGTDTPFVYDDKMFTVGLDTNTNKKQKLNSKRLYGKITPDLLKQVSQLADLENPQIKLHIKSGNLWTTYESNSFGYYINKKPYLGYPIFFEQSNTFNNQQIKSFLPSYVLESPNFLYRSHILSSSNFHPDFYNHLVSNNLNDYFSVPSIIDLYQQTYKPEINPTDQREINSSSPGAGYFEYHKHLLNSNTFLKDYKSNTNLYYANQTLLSKEDTLFPVSFLTKNTLSNSLLRLETFIINKYLYLDSTTGKKYCLFRLFPYIQNSIFDYSKQQDSALYRKNNNLHLEIIRNINNKKTWTDIYGYDMFKSFDITNRLDRDYSPDNLAYDNIFYQLGLYNYSFLLFHKQIPSTTLNSLKLDPKKISSLSFSLQTESNIKYDKSIVDYKNPSLFLNYYSKPKIKHIEEKELGQILDRNLDLVSCPLIEKGTEIPITGNLKLDKFLTLNPNNDAPDGYFWIDIDIEHDLINHTKSNELNFNVKSQFFKLYEPYYILSNTDTTTINPGNNNYSCKDIIRPKTNKYNNTLGILNQNTKVFDSILYVPPEPRTIYCNIDNVKGCEVNCDMPAIQSYQYKSKYTVGSDDKYFQTPSPGPFYITVGNGSYHNYPYISRTRIDNSNRNIFTPNLMPDNTLVNDGNMSLPTDELEKRQPYGVNEYFAKNNILMDFIANEMLFRLYYGSLPGEGISTNFIGKQSIENYRNKQKLETYKNLIENNQSISPKEIYELLPYEYDENTTKAKSDNLTYTGNIGILGTPKVGDVVVVKIGNITLNISIINKEDGVYISVNNKEVLYKQTKFETSNVFALLQGTKVSFPSGSVTRKISECRVFVPGLWSIVHYYTKAICKKCEPNEDGELIDIDLLAVYKTLNNLTFYYGFEPPESNIPGKTLMSQPPRACNGLGLEGRSPVARGLLVGPPPPTTFSQSYDINPKGRGTVAPNVCIGSFPVGCSDGSTFIVSARETTANLAGGQLTEGIGSLGALAGGSIPKDPFAMSPNCGYKNPCGGTLCLPLSSTDKFGVSIFNNKKLVLPSVDAKILPACECLPYVIGKCDAEPATCYTCVSRNKNNFTYMYENGPYSFNLRGFKYVDTSTDSPVPSNLVSVPFLDPPCLPKGPITNVGGYSIEASEVCGLSKSLSQTVVYDIYQQTTTLFDKVSFLCQEFATSITYDNNKVLVTIKDTVLCFEAKQLIGKCPKLEVVLPNNTYSVSDNISSNCASCAPQSNKIKLQDSDQKWETIIEKRIGVLSYVNYNGEKNNILIDSNEAHIPEAQCGPVPPPTSCNDERSIGATAQCGSSWPSSYPWKYCINCRIPGSNGASLEAGNWTYGGIVRDCVSVSFQNWATPQFAGAKNIYLEEWKKSVDSLYLDVAPCHNNQNINVEDMIEGVVPGSCGGLKYETIDYPGLAYRRTPTGAESSNFTLGVMVAYFEYEYKRPLNIQDKLGKPECEYYNLPNAPGPPINNANMVEKYINGGPCGDDIICEDKKLEKCDETNYCCLTNARTMRIS